MSGVFVVRSRGLFLLVFFVGVVGVVVDVDVDVAFTFPVSWCINGSIWGISWLVLPCL